MTGAWCRACGLRARVRAWVQARVGYQLARGCLELGLAIRLHDLDLLDDLAGLAAELVGELVRVEGPRDDHLVVLLIVLDIVDAELALLCNPK